MQAPATRPPLRRMQWWDTQLRAGRFPTLAACCAEFEISDRTAYRDLDFLREQLGAPLAFDRRRRGWRYTDVAFSLPSVLLTEGELVALFLAEKVLAQYRSAPYAADLRRAFDRLCAVLPDQVLLDMAGLEQALTFNLGPARTVMVEVLTAVVRAARRRGSLELRYYVPERDEDTTRTVDPLVVYTHSGDWYLAGFCHLRGRVQDFALSRIRQLRETGLRFSPPPDFDRDAYLRRGFGVFKSGEPQAVALHFDAYQARWIRERTWHHTQQLEEQPDGSLVLRLTVPVAGDLLRWVLSYGSHVRVLAPPELAEAIREEISRMLAK